MWRPKLKWFLDRGQNWPCLLLRVENVLFLVWAWKLTSFLWWELIWCQRGESKLSWFQFRDEITFVVWVVEISLLLVCCPKITCFSDEHEPWLGFCVGGPKWHNFSVGDRVWLHLSVGMELIWLLRGWWKLTWLLNAGRKSLVSSISVQIDLHLVWVVRIDLISVWGIEVDFVPV